MGTKKNIFIIGDHISDVHLYNPSRSNNKDFDMPNLYPSESGCGLYKYLLSEDERWNVEILTNNCTHPKSYEIWETSPNNDECIVINNFLGVDKNDKNVNYDNIAWKQTEIADLLIIDDLNILFREQFDGSKLENVLNDSTVIAYKATHKFNEQKNKIYQWINERRANYPQQKIVIIIKDDVIINETKKINSYVSWYSILKNFKEEIDTQEFKEIYAPFNDVYIQFDCTALFQIKKDKRTSAYLIDNIVYNPYEIPKQYLNDNCIKSFGTTATILANIIPCLFNEKPEDCLLGSVMKARYLTKQFKVGIGKNLFESIPNLFMKVGSKSDINENKDINTDKDKKINRNTYKFQFIKIPAKTADITECFIQKVPSDDHQLATDIVTKGIDDGVLGKIPRIQIKNFISIKRKEIEELNSIKKLITNYKEKDKDMKPLSIAVFGEPGSGKSFCIKQLLLEIYNKDHFLEFNLSQFNDNSNDLGDAFQKIRDMTIRNKVPVVFWDEFDSNDLNWLKYFLMPMNDGKFVQNGLEMSLSKAIFIFAGGCSSSFDTFSDENRSEYKIKKIPDFCSRLQGYINIEGINYITDEGKSNDRKLSRAILMNTLIKTHFDSIFRNNQINIEQNVLNAFLETKKFKHGVRSLEAIIKMSSNKDSKKFTRSSLPLDHQLLLHTEKDFIEIIDKPIK